MTNDETILVRLRAVAGRRPTCRAGPRLLTDMYLARLGIDRGYEREEYTHLAVAASVKNGAADTGLAILAAAKALDLDFIPVATERYDRHFQGVSPLCQDRGRARDHSAERFVPGTDHGAWRLRSARERDGGVRTESRTVAVS